MWVHNIDPVLLSVGPLSIHWYGIMYLIGFASAWWLGTYRAKKMNLGWTEEQISDLIFQGALGVVLGGRIGYVLFYNLDRFIEDPLWLFAVWEGGMSFHGGLLGVIVMMLFFSRKHHKNILDISDFVVPLLPIGLGAGRIGNFIGGELWGRPTEQPWGIIFPRADGLPRHPSQLYEFALEGVVLFVILWWFSAAIKPRAAVSGLFLLLYGLFRTLVEFVREPDIQLQFVAFNWMTMGQILSLPMIIIGAGILIWAYRQEPDDK